MAETIPLEVPSDATRGEKQIFALLKAALVPHEEFIVWFEPKPPGVRQRPDFLVWSQRMGLLILEVKDWAIGQIVEMNATHCTILKGEQRREDHPSPTEQAYKYSLEYRDYLYRQPELRDQRPGYGGKLIFPVGYCAAFPNIRREEAGRIVSVLGDSLCVFADDLEVNCADPDARAGLTAKLKNAFSVRFSFDPLSAEQRGSAAPLYLSGISCSDYSASRLELSLKRDQLHNFPAARNGQPNYHERPWTPGTLTLDGMAVWFRRCFLSGSREHLSSMAANFFPAHQSVACPADFAGQAQGSKTEER